MEHSGTFPLQGMQLAWPQKGQGSCNSCNCQLWEGSPAPGCTCQGTPTRALPGQELPSLSVDSEMEFAILNRARVHRQHNGTASASVPVNSSFPLLPLQLWSQAFSTQQLHEHSNVLL